MFRAHTPSEGDRKLVLHKVAARLDPEKRYGVWWFIRAHKTEKRVAVETPNGREYKTRSKTVARPRSEWIVVPAALSV